MGAEYQDLPATLIHRDFPVGDVQSMSKVTSALELVENMRDRLDDRLDLANYLKLSLPEIHRETDNFYRDALKMSDLLAINADWMSVSLAHDKADQEIDERDIEEYSSLANFSTYLGATVAGRMLPNPGVDLRAEALSMQQMDLAQLVSFGDNAWAGMAQSHPNVFEVMQLLRSTTLKSLPKMSEGRRILVDGALALPYVTSVMGAEIRRFQAATDLQAYIGELEA